MALVNRRVFLQYDVPGQVLWHERLLLAHCRGEEYAIVTPDQDVYIEEISLSNSDLRAIRIGAPGGGRPIGVRAGQIHALPAFTPAQLAGFQAEAARQITQELGAGGVGPLLGGGAAPAGAGVGVAVGGAAVAAAGVAGPMVAGAGGGAAAAAGAAAGLVFDPDTLCWLAAESVAGFSFGDPVANVLAAAAEGVKIVHQLPGGVSIFLECCLGRNREAFLRRPGGWDQRTCLMQLNSLNQPEQSLKDAAARSVESAVGWVLTGPRTTKWCLGYLVSEGLGLEGHHERLRTLCRVDASAWGIQEHFQLSMVAKHALLTDQLNGPNLLCLEVIFRRIQAIEFAYGEKARESEAKAVGGRLSLEEQQVFGGLTRQAGTLMVCPALLDYVKSETEREASLSKNLRKAREERELARKKKGAGRDDT